MQTKRLYSSLTIKNFNEDERLIEGVATTPTTDRMGDIVESEGAQYSLPIPLLWQHDSSQPVGHVEACQVTKDGIAITARMVQVTEPGTLKDRLDEAWQSIKSGLVRGLSIGFVPIESNRIKDSLQQIHDGGSAVRLEVLDRSVSGPLCMGLDSSGAGAAAHTDVIIQGY